LRPAAPALLARADPARARHAPVRLGDHERALARRPRRATRRRRSRRRDLAALPPRLQPLAASVRPAPERAPDPVSRPRRWPRLMVLPFLRAARRLRVALIPSERLQRVLLTPGREPWLETIGGWRAWMAFEDARDCVPAYREFLDANGGGEVVLGKRWRAS